MEYHIRSLGSKRCRWNGLVVRILLNKVRFGETRKTYLIEASYIKETISYDSDSREILSFKNQKTYLPWPFPLLPPYLSEKFQLILIWDYKKSYIGAPGSVKYPTSAQVMISWFLSSSPAWGSILTPLSLLGILSLPPPAPPPLAHVCVCAHAFFQDK